MIKNWEKSDETKYSLLVDGNEVGTMEIIPSSADTKAVLKIGDTEYVIRRTGFWRNSIEIINSEKIVIGKAYAEKWYANVLTLDFNEKKYTLFIRNNPLAEWAISDGHSDLLAYGLNTGNSNGMVNVKISTHEDNREYLLDFLLWYLFAPIASEHVGDSFTFMMLTVA